jgi:hypothetical protein
MRVHDWHAWEVFGWKKKAKSRSFAENEMFDEEGEDDEEGQGNHVKVEEVKPTTKKKLPPKPQPQPLNRQPSQTYKLPPPLPLELRQPEVHYHRNVGKGSLMATSSSSSPNLSQVWWWFKHPNLRIMVGAAMIPLDTFIYISEPSSYSRARKFGFLYRYFNFSNSHVSALDIVYRLLLCLFIAMCAITFGLTIHRVLRDYFKLPLFGYMKPEDVKYKRWRLSHQDGTFYLILVGFFWFLYFGIKVYIHHTNTHTHTYTVECRIGGRRHYDMRFSLIIFWT